MDPRFLAIENLRGPQPAPAVDVRQLVARPRPNKYQAALDNQLAKAKAIAAMQQRQAQARAAAKQPRQPVTQAVDPKQVIDGGLRDGNVSYANLDHIGMNRDQFNKFRDGVVGIKQRYGMK